MNLVLFRKQRLFYLALLCSISLLCSCTPSNSGNTNLSNGGDESEPIDTAGDAAGDSMAIEDPAGEEEELVKKRLVKTYHLIWAQ